MIKKGYYFLHSKESTIDSDYDYKKFIYLVYNKIDNFYITGISFGNYSYKNLCPHDTKVDHLCNDDFCNDDIIASEKTYDKYLYPICRFKKIYDDNRISIWINENNYTEYDRDIKLEILFNK